jgi:hypothetical protein
VQFIRDKKQPIFHWPMTRPGIIEPGTCLSVQSKHAMRADTDVPTQLYSLQLTIPTETDRKFVFNDLKFNPTLNPPQVLSLLSDLICVTAQPDDPVQVLISPSGVVRPWSDKSDLLTCAPHNWIQQLSMWR